MQLMQLSLPHVGKLHLKQ